MRSFVHRSQLGAFFLLAFGISWVAWVAGGVLFSGLPGPLVILGGFGPAFAAMAVSFLGGAGDFRELIRRIAHWRVPASVYLYALVVPPGLYLVAAGALHLLADFRFPAAAPSLLAYPGVLLYAAVLGGGQGEIGWRGFALPRLQAAMAPLDAGLLLGFLWALWYLPLFFLPGAPGAGTPLLPHVATIVGLSVIMTWLHNVSGGSALVAVLFHAGTRVAPMWYPLGLCLGFTSSAGIIALIVWVAAGILVWRSGERLGFPG